MAVQFHVGGPTTVRIGASTGTLVGQSDGNVLITIREKMPHRAITTDAAGGEPEEFIQQMGHAIVVIQFIQWDTTQLDKLLSAIASTSTSGTPVQATRGNIGEVGMLRIADGGTSRVLIAGTKKTASNGSQQFIFPRAMRDPDAETELSEFGNDAGRRSIVLRCQPDASGDFYTNASIT